MEADEAAARAHTIIPQNLVLEFTRQEFRDICSAAAKDNLSPNEWSEKQLKQLVYGDIEEIASYLSEFPTSMVAETGPKYTTKKKAHIMAAAGSGIAAEVIDWEGTDGTVNVRACGDSMAPKFQDGDIITFRHKSTSRSPYMKKGLIYLVQLAGDWMIKRYNTRPATEEEKTAEYLTSSGTVGILESLNPTHKPIDITSPCEWAAWYDETLDQ